VHAAELLLRTGRFDVALELIGETVVRNPEDIVALRLLSEAQMLVGRPEDALGAIDRALAIAPQMAEYHLYSPEAFFL
jgi:tetratricopeptide (TPR) repeat protein